MQVVGVKNNVTFRVDQQKAQCSIIINSVIKSYARGFTHRGPIGYRSHCRRRPRKYDCMQAACNHIFLSWCAISITTIYWTAYSMVGVLSNVLQRDQFQS